MGATLGDAVGATLGCEGTCVGPGAGANVATIEHVPVLAVHSRSPQSADSTGQLVEASSLAPRQQHTRWEEKYDPSHFEEESVM